MAVLDPEVIGLARVDLAYDANSGITTPTFDFVDGFDASKVDGAVSYAPTIYSPSAGVFVLFHDDPVDPGSVPTQGGLKARVDIVAVATATNTGTIAATLAAAALIEPRWYYSDYVLPTNLYPSTSPKKALVISLYRFSNRSELPYVGAVKFDVVVTRDPVTKFVGKQST